MARMPEGKDMSQERALGGRMDQGWGRPDGRLRRWKGSSEVHHCLRCRLPGLVPVPPVDVLSRFF